MSENLLLKETEDTPEVVFDKEAGLFSIKGRSYPENPREFYQPIAQWLKDYGQQPNSTTNFEVDLEYINSGSVKEIFSLLYLVEDISESGHEAKIIWKYKEGDELMHQKGLEFSDYLDVPVELHPHS
ncbi:DUF1987 domain-containing protein [Paracrocinitomix mangrovi]|uniref:DUF1987 domain-containing protein n=1 Tax=Paracrocinitomix mangrovi TaxID=2862509 RepID=UPI001C8EF6F4|nr:DUF1987 domain-containing protein [Paracrocinitomix mangrovi]UKN01440.1 DUF1987 domain-containing protein [Paracrocinitomix mangrovi]